MAAAATSPQLAAQTQPPFAASPSGGPSLACSPSPPSIETQDARPPLQRNPQLTQPVAPAPPGGPQSPPLVKSADPRPGPTNDDSTTNNLDTVREEPCDATPNSRRNSKRLSIPLPPQLPPPTGPLPVPPGRQGRVVARAPPMAYLASSPGPSQVVNDFNFPRSDHLVSPVSSPGPSSLGHSARSEREAYLSSALQLPLEMISELAPPGFGQQTPQVSRPPSPSKSGRVTNLLARARSTVSLRHHGGAHEQPSDPQKQDSSKPMANGRRSPTPEVPSLPTSLSVHANLEAEDPAGPRPQPIRRSSHAGPMHHYTSADRVVGPGGPQGGRGRSASTGHPPVLGSAPIQPGQMMARTGTIHRPNSPPNAPVPPPSGSVAFGVSPPSSRPHMMAPGAPPGALPPNGLPHGNHPPAPLPGSGLPPRGPSPPHLPGTPPTSGLSQARPPPGLVRSPSMGQGAVPVPVPLRSPTLPPAGGRSPDAQRSPTMPPQPLPPASPTTGAVGITRKASRDGAPRVAVPVPRPGAAAVAVPNPVAMQPVNDPFAAAPNPAAGTAPSAPSQPMPIPPRTHSVPPPPIAIPSSKSRSTERLVEKLRGSAMTNQNQSSVSTDSGGIESLGTTPKRSGRLRVSMNWLHGRSRNEGENSRSQSDDQRVSGSTRSKLSSVQEHTPTSPVARSGPQPVNATPKRNSLLFNYPAKQYPYSTPTHQHATSLPNVHQYPTGMATPQRPSQPQMPRGLPTPSPPHDRKDPPDGPMWYGPPPAQYPPSGSARAPPPPIVPKGVPPMQPVPGTWTYQVAPLSPPASPRISQSMEHLPSQTQRTKHRWLHKVWPFSGKANPATVPQPPTTRQWQDEAARARAAPTSPLRRSRSVTPPPARHRFTFHRADKSKAKPARQNSEDGTASQTNLANAGDIRHPRKRSLSDSDQRARVIVTRASESTPRLVSTDSTSGGAMETMSARTSSDTQQESVLNLAAALKMEDKDVPSSAAEQVPVAA